jgi:hypothetical protein
MLQPLSSHRNWLRMLVRSYCSPRNNCRLRYFGNHAGRHNLILRGHRIRRMLEQPDAEKHTDQQRCRHRYISAYLEEAAQP